MPYSLDDKLVVGISSRALFDLADANAVYESEGIELYREYQRAHETEALRPGTGFPLVRALLAINRRLPPDQRLVEVIVISRNDADSAMRVFNSIDEYNLDISRGAFTNGGDSWRYLTAFRCSLFLSLEPTDVVAALREGFPAALLMPPPEGIIHDEEAGPVRIAFDGDAVLFGDEAQSIFDAGTLADFHEHERLRADEPLDPGPFRPFLDALGRVQAHFPPDDPPIRTALVTARDAPAHRRVINTLRSWKVRIDETFFLGGVPKTDVLGVLRPHIFFDDQLSHLEAAAAYVPSGQVIRPEQLELLPDAELPPQVEKAKRRGRREKPGRPRMQEVASPSAASKSKPDDPMASRRRAYGKRDSERPDIDSPRPAARRRSRPPTG
jgi:5'-nucleotidase